MRKTVGRLVVVGMVVLGMSSVTQARRIPHGGGFGGDRQIGSIGRHQDCKVRGNKVVIKLYGQQYRGFSSIGLKRLVKKSCGVKLRGSHLKAVKLVAKSRVGFGRAALMVGDEMTKAERVGGSRYKFRGPGGYDRILFHNPSFDSYGPWKLKLRGNIKVKKIVLKVEDLDHHDDDMDF